MSESESESETDNGNEPLHVSFPFFSPSPSPSNLYYRMSLLRSLSLSVNEPLMHIYTNSSSAKRADWPMISSL